MTDIPSGERVFVDANVLIYHFTAQSDECSTLLQRIERGELEGSTGQTVVLEVAHRLMIFEAIEQGLGEGSRSAARLSRRPELTRRLSKYFFSTLKIPQVGVRILGLPDDFLVRSQEYRQVHGLLVNDSLIPLYMRDAGTSLLASADAQFDRVPWIRRAAPSDISLL